MVPKCVFALRLISLFRSCGSAPFVVGITACLEKFGRYSRRIRIVRIDSFAGRVLAPMDLRSDVRGAIYFSRPTLTSLPLDIAHYEQRVFKFPMRRVEGYTPDASFQDIDKQLIRD